MAPSRLHPLALALLRRPETGALAGTVAIGILFTALSSSFLTLDNSTGVIRQAAELGIVAAGVTALAIAGEFDLSVGAILGLSSFLYPYFVNQGLPPVLGVVVSLLLAGLMGAINGGLVVGIGISSFVATLATQFVYRGILLALSGGFAIQVTGDGVVGTVFASSLPGGFDVSLLWFAGVAIVMTILLTRTPFGNWAYAAGGNRQAARSLGVPVGRVKIVMFTLTGVLGGVVGIIQVARFLSVDPLRGQGVELEAITAAVIGGTLLTGGFGSQLGTVLGSIIIGMVNTGLILAGAPPYYFQAFIGLVLVVAVVINMRVQALIASRL